VRGSERTLAGRFGMGAGVPGPLPTPGGGAAVREFAGAVVAAVVGVTGVVPAARALVGPPPPAGTFTQISVGFVAACMRRRLVVLPAAIAGALAAWPAAPALAIVAPAGTFTAVSAGDGSACAIRTDQTLVCFGSNFTVTPVPPAGTFTAVSTAGAQACAVRTDQTLACWGTPFGPAANPVPPPAGTFTAVSVGGGFACALRTDQTLACWPGNISTPPTGTFTSVSAGRAGISCAVGTDTTLSCWPAGSISPASPVPTGTFTSVAVGGGIACALRTDQSPACFQNFEGLAMGLPPGAYTAVSANAVIIVSPTANTATFQMVCALRTDATALCVAPHLLTAQVTPPGPFTAIAAGDFFACGIRPDATLVCWPGPTPVGAPPLPAAGAPTTPPPAAPAGHGTGVQGAHLPRLPAAFGKDGVFTLPSNRSCVSRRRFRIRVRRQRAGVTLVSAAVSVNGRRVAVRRGARLTAPVDLRGLPKGRFTVRISALTADGRAISGTRRYRTCAPRRASGGHGPLVLGAALAGEGR
jgi:hypothetical protein